MPKFKLNDLVTLKNNKTKRGKIVNIQACECCFIIQWSNGDRETQSYFDLIKLATKHRLTGIFK